MNDVKKIVGSVFVIIILIGIGFGLGTWRSSGKEAAIRNALERTESRLLEAVESTRTAEKYVQFLKGEQLEDKRRLEERRKEIEGLQEKVKRQDELIDAFGTGIDESEEIIKRIQERNKRSLEIVRQLQE